MTNNQPIDWALCVKLSNNNPDIAQELLDLFAQELPSVKNDIQKAQSAANLSDLNNVVHKLHGACCYVGVPQLTALVTDAEIYLKQNNSEKFTPLLSAIINEITRIEKSLQQGFEK